MNGRFFRFFLSLLRRQLALPGPKGREHFVRRARGRYCELLSARGERGDGEMW